MNEIIFRLQDFGLISKDHQLKCPIESCDGFLKLFKDKSTIDGFRWNCSGTIRQQKKKSIKCTKRLIYQMF